MSKKIGIPRALFYHQFYPLWETFFEGLGVEIVVSDHTTKKILDDGVKSCVDEACLPVKLYYGHVANLIGKVDYLFIPRFTSISKKEYVFPKFGGLPDMIRHNLNGLPEIIDTEINLRKSTKHALKAAMEIGSYFTEDKSLIRQAYAIAMESHREHKERLKKGILPMDVKKKIIPSRGNNNGKMLNIAVIGHVYNLYDSYLNMDMIPKLAANGVNIITIDMLDSSVVDELSQQIPKKMFWYFGRKAFGSALHILDRKDIDGVIYVMSFGCGVDSFVCDLVERKIRRSRDIPFIILTIDEHSGEAGMDTRLEAFIDMIGWRKKNEADISASG